MRPSTDIAIIIPVLDDLEALIRLGQQIDRLHSAPAEVIVVTGTVDSTLGEHAREHGYHYVESPVGRGIQLDRGAHLATARILWFLHADAEIEPTALDEITRAVDRGADGGCFRFAFQGPVSAIKRTIEVGVALRVRCGGIAYGDQAIFCTRTAYRAAGGFTHDPLFEEVALIKGLRRPPHRFEALQAAIRVAPRRWERDGWLRRSLHNRWLALCYACGVSPRALDRRYRRASATDEASPRMSRD